ncbi:Alpha/beta hydrolase [Candidatus Koribacter versatilis Ellin345]|uniref:Alpha/beta hydrolase n=1 Tax=Koribacter versatilis (strain Ellin345) TaxID=204669 RepID=Q1IU18_KORVE|nr:Alpha/beta hydrolase [Candidatus Koribacter versatilis Ellin345]
MIEAQQTFLGQTTEHDFTLPTGHRMHYRKVGNGPPVVLIHGLIASSFSWRFNLPALAQHFTCYAVDLLGMGDAERPSGVDVSPRGLAEGLVAFLKAQSGGPWSIIGTSHGGAVAIWLARLARAAGLELNRLVLSAPANPWSQHGRRLAPFAAHPISRAVVKASRWAYIPVRRMTFSRMYGDRRLITKETLAGYARPLKIKGTVPHCLDLLKNWVRNVDELEGVMRGIDVPTLLVWGTKDRLVYFSSAQRMLETIPDARLLKIEGAGHLPYEERPEEWNAAVVPFLRDAH